MNFLLNLLGWHWLIKLCRFQTYTSIIHPLDIVLCAHHPKSPSITVPLPVTFFYLSPSLFASGNHQTCLWVFFLFCFDFCSIPSFFHPAPLEVLAGRRKWGKSWLWSEGLGPFLIQNHQEIKYVVPALAPMKVGYHQHLHLVFHVQAPSSWAISCWSSAGSSPG